MELYTLPIRDTDRYTAQGIHVVNATLQSGLVAFAPTKEMVQSILAIGANKRPVRPSDALTIETYTKSYLELLKRSTSLYPSVWDSLLQYERVGFACYCSGVGFCHRYVLRDYAKSYYESVLGDLVVTHEETVEPVIW